MKDVNPIREYEGGLNEHSWGNRPVHTQVTGGEIRRGRTDYWSVNPPGGDFQSSRKRQWVSGRDEACDNKLGEAFSWKG